MKKKVTGDQFLMKKINKSIVLETIIQRSPISRSAISELTGLNKATVSTMVNELTESHLVDEIGPGQSSGGRKPLMLLFNNRAGYAIGIDLGVNYILGILTDLSGNIVSERRIQLEDLSSQSLLEKLNKCVRYLLKKCPDSPYGVIGIGIGVPGMVDEQGTVQSAPNLGWKMVPLREQLIREFNLPVTIDNEANAGAYGEKQFGAGKNNSPMIYVSVGIGIGTGIILQDELYRGVSGFSGEMGHMSIVAEGLSCRCGNRGCWELYASEKALLQQADELPAVRRAYTDSGRKLDLSLLIELAKAGNADVAALFRRIGTYLGVGIANIVNIFNPKLVVIGNRMTLAKDWIHPGLAEAFGRRSLPSHQSYVKLAFSDLGIHSAALGAASFAITHFFSDMKASLE